VRFAARVDTRGFAIQRLHATVGCGEFVSCKNELTCIESQSAITPPGNYCEVLP
jgi:hypothetical protein